MRTAIKVLLSLFLVLLLLAGAAFYCAWWYENNVDRSGWTVENGVYSYQDFYGDPVTGWQEIDGSTYYFFPTDATMATYWQEIDGERYWFSGDGTLDTGLWSIDGSTYYLEEDGRLHTGWLELEGNRYYMDADGAMQTGWQEIDGKLYYFEKNGEMQTGWLSLGENDYYLREDGSAAIGPAEIDGELRYFSPKGIHVVLVNATHKVPSWYTMELKTVVDWNQVSTECYSALVNMLSDMERDGIQCNFNSAYRTIKQQQEILTTRTQEYEDKGYDSASAYWKARETVALPGTSEHHLGLAVDLLGEEALAWLHEHCWDYGFIVRYAGDKAHITGIIEEPWHFRYVGVDVALDMKDSGLCLEEYLGAVPIEQPDAPTEPQE